MNYVSYASAQAEEVLASLSQDDVQHLRADLEQLGLEGWLDWAETNRAEANDYLRATEKQRGKKKKWQEPVTRRRLCLSAYHQGRLAVAMLDAASRLGPGGGYRDTTAYAASRGQDVLLEGIARWPFENPPKDWPGLRPEFGWQATGSVAL